MTATRAILGGMFLALLATRAFGQAAPYPLQEMNFDMWCQEQKHLPPDRCDQRLPADDAEFQAFRSTIEHYEIPYLRERQREQNLNTVILHNDPEDKPTVLSQPQPDQPPTQH
ncbi:MAG TPA: hypothetical protein VGF97_08175 [Rhizomicrobium sp.]|jgi:hypothetical protein